MSLYVKTTLANMEALVFHSPGAGTFVCVHMAGGAISAKTVTSILVKKLITLLQSTISDLEITQPYFSSSIYGYSSFVSYPIPSSISERFEMNFRFSPTTIDQISVLLFIGQKGLHDFHSDHMAVSFVKGYIMLTWNLGSGKEERY